MVTRMRINITLYVHCFVLFPLDSKNRNTRRRPIYIKCVCGFALSPNWAQGSKCSQPRSLSCACSGRNQRSSVIKCLILLCVAEHRNISAFTSHV